MALFPPNTGITGKEPGGILLSIGSSCDVCFEEDERRGTVQIYFTDGRLEPFATGLRNSVFLTEARGNVWATEMGRDFLGDDLPPDEVNILAEPRDYGWPICYGKNVHDRQFDKNVYIRDPCLDKVSSKIDLPAHSAPLGLVFVPKWAGWPEEYEGNLLVAYHGSWNRSTPTGYKIRRFVLDNSGNVIHEEDFVTGWLKGRDVLGRPVDLKFGPDRSLYVSDDHSGVIYRVTPPGALSE
jgi:glucose/arabinose dehydrogenase